jgi:hypothetical protein
MCLKNHRVKAIETRKHRAFWSGSSSTTPGWVHATIHITAAKTIQAKPIHALGELRLETGFSTLRDNHRQRKIAQTGASSSKEKLGCALATRSASGQLPHSQKKISPGKLRLWTATGTGIKKNKPGLKIGSQVRGLAQRCKWFFWRRNEKLDRRFFLAAWRTDLRQRRTEMNRGIKSGRAPVLRENGR